MFASRVSAPRRPAWSAGKPYEAKFEFDLFGTGVDAGQTTFRVRHMYAKWGPFLAGQTNTLFMDGDIFPNVLDYWGPTGHGVRAQPADPLDLPDNDGHWKAAVALEHPSDDIDPGNIRLIDEDIAANIQAERGAARSHRRDPLRRRLGPRPARRHPAQDRLRHARNGRTMSPSGHETGWGINATAAIKLGLATPRLGVVYGRGIATYMNDGGMDLAPAVSHDRTRAAERRSSSCPGPKR